MHSIEHSILHLDLIIQSYAPPLKHTLVSTYVPVPDLAQPERLRQSNEDLVRGVSMRYLPYKID